MKWVATATTSYGRGQKFEGEGKLQEIKCDFIHLD